MMNLRTVFTAGLVALAIAATGCASDYDAEWGAEGFASGGKADGLEDSAIPLEPGNTVSDNVGGNAMVLFRIDLADGDTVIVTMNVTAGDLNPHATLFFGLQTHIRSDSFSISGGNLTKTYTLDTSGTYFIAARAYRGEGSGDFDLTVNCQSGPCKGGLIPAEDPANMTGDDAVACISDATDCAFERLPGFGGLVGEVRANEIFTECLEESMTRNNRSCARVCEFNLPGSDISAQQLCDYTVGELPFYADQSAACYSVLGDCLLECEDLNNYDVPVTNNLGQAPFSMCWMTGIDSQCNAYARTHQACGGSAPSGGAAECVAFCSAVYGAGLDSFAGDCAGDCFDAADNRCAVDGDAAADQCGVASYDPGNPCIVAWFEDHNVQICL